MEPSEQGLKVVTPLHLTLAVLSHSASTYMGIRDMLRHAGIPEDNPTVIYLVTALTNTLRADYADRPEELFKLDAITLGNVMGLVVAAVQDQATQSFPYPRRPQ